MPRCEDYPCCGHGPPPLGDGGGCPRTVDGPEETCPECEGTKMFEEEECQNCNGKGVITSDVTEWQCVLCGIWFQPGGSSICDNCLTSRKFMDDDDHEYYPEYEH